MGNGTKLEEQINLLAAWNKENINEEPEQVRANIETICVAIDLLLRYPGIR